MDQIDIAKIIAYLMILPPDNTFCRLVKEFAESGQDEDMDTLDRIFDRHHLNTMLTAAVFDIQEDMEEWETEGKGPSLMEIVQKMVSSEEIFSDYNRIRFRG